MIHYLICQYKSKYSYQHAILLFIFYIIAAQILFLRHFACFVAVIMQNDVDAFYTLSYNNYIDIVHTAQLYFISALQ